MKLTKHEHACVALEKDGTTLIIDPGTFSPLAAQLIAAADAIALTHEHMDHVHAEAITAALAQRPELRVYGPASVAAQFGPHGPQYVSVGAGDGFDVGSFHLTVHGGDHAVIHPDIPVVANVGYLVDDSLYHPGDSFYVPKPSVRTLCVPASGPWLKIGEAADFVRAVRPERSVQIHESLYSDIGLMLAGNLLGESGLTGVPLVALKPGESVTA